MKNNIKPKFLIGQKVKCFRCVFTTIESINVSASKFEYGIKGYSQPQPEFHIENATDDEISVYFI